MHYAISSGSTIPIYYPANNEPHQAAIFVAVFGASSYTFAESTSGQDLNSDWIPSRILISFTAEW